MVSTLARKAVVLGAGSALGLGSFLALQGTADAATGNVVTKPAGAVVRKAPTTQSGAELTLKGKSRVSVSCWVNGPAKGNGVTQRWYKYEIQGLPSTWIASEALSSVSPSVKECTTTKTVGRTTTALTARTGPHTSSAPVTTLGARKTISLVCKVQSQNIGGNSLWYYTSQGSWVSAKYITNVGAAPQWCTRAA